MTISIEGGEEVAKRTFNPHIGVEGGLSVLGTSGIVEPMSQQAILDTIQLEMNQAALRAGSPRRLILAPGNYGLDYLHERYPEFHAVPVVKTSNLSVIRWIWPQRPALKRCFWWAMWQAGQGGGRYYEHPFPHGRLPHGAVLHPCGALRRFPEVCAA